MAAPNPTPPRWLLPRAAYVHVPFCAHHCGYCDFAVVAGRDAQITAYLDALERELAGLDSPRDVETIFIGGGTPTYLPPRLLERLMAMIRRWLPLSPGGEWSIESTPDSLDDERVAILADAGVNRVSIGVQSFNDAMLRALDRRHLAAAIGPAIDCVRRRIDNVALDLIFAAPGQTLADWQGDLSEAVRLGVDHLSCYGLTFEKGTPFWKERSAGTIAPAPEELERAMFLFAREWLPSRGLDAYEVSNYARPDRRCRHNEVYWANHAYHGFGLGAARYVDGSRELNTRSLVEYLSRVAAGRSPTIQRERLTGEERARETMSLQLRRSAGIERESFRAQTGIAIDDLAGPSIARLVELGLLGDDGVSVHLTDAGLCVADGVIAELWASEGTGRVPLASL